MGVSATVGESEVSHEKDDEGGGGGIMQDYMGVNKHAEEGVFMKGEQAPNESPNILPLFWKN